MANVYLAVMSGPSGFNKLQVIKQLRSHLAETPEFLAMFMDEARLAARLNHPNVVQTNEVGEHDGMYFLAMEYLDGQPLDRVLRRARSAGGLPLTTYIRILVDVLSGLHHAHELTDYDGAPLLVVHRDVSPPQRVRDLRRPNQSGGFRDRQSRQQLGGDAHRRPQRKDRLHVPGASAGRRGRSKNRRVLGRG